MGFSEWFEKPDPEKECRKWTRQLRREMRRMDREVRGIEREEKKLQKEIRKLAKQGHMGAIKSLARELVASKKAKERLWTCKANMNSVKMQMRSNLSMLKMSKAVKSSTKVMQSMAESMVADTAAVDSTESLFDDNFNVMWRWPYNATNPGLVNRFIIPRKGKDGYPDYYFYDKNRNYANDTLACPPQLLKTAVYSKTPKCTIKGLMFCDMERHENHPIWAKRKYYVPHYKAVGEYRPAINRTRRNILQRAIGWLAFHVPYGGQCHSSTFKWTVPETCAEDDNPSCPQYTHTSVCNGLVNMAWGVPNTILGKYSEHINCTDLRPGDQVALNARKGGLAHQFIFRNWVKKPLGNMRVYQMGGEHGAANVDTIQFPPRKFCTDTLKTKCYKCSRYLRVIEDGEQTSVAVL